MVFIKDFLNLLMGKEPLENCIDTMMIKGVTNDYIIFGLILNTSLLGVRGIRMECLCLEIYKDVSIPRVR